MSINEKPDRNGRNGIQVIARAAAILRVLKDRRTGLSLGQIAAEVKLPRSTVQRITGALAAERLVISDLSGGGLRLGPELAALAEAANYNIVERCRPILDAITRETGETTDLATLRDDGMIFIDQVPGPQRLRTVSSVGDVLALTTTAHGRACLALMPEADALGLAKRERARRADDVEMESFASLLDTVRLTGLAYDMDEHSQGISAVGTAFRDRGGNFHAISVPVPSVRFGDVREKIEGALLRARQQAAAIFPEA